MVRVPRVGRWPGLVTPSSGSDLRQAWAHRQQARHEPTIAHLRLRIPPVVGPWIHLHWNKHADAVVEPQSAHGQPARPRELTDHHHLCHPTSVNARPRRGSNPAPESRAPVGYIQLARSVIGTPDHRRVPFTAHPHVGYERPSGRHAASNSGSVTGHRWRVATPGEGAAWVSTFERWSAELAFFHPRQPGFHSR